MEIHTRTNNSKGRKFYSIKRPLKLIRYAPHCAIVAGARMLLKLNTFERKLQQVLRIPLFSSGQFFCQKKNKQNENLPKTSDQTKGVTSGVNIQIMNKPNGTAEHAPMDNAAVHFFPMLNFDGKKLASDYRLHQRCHSSISIKRCMLCK